MMSIFKNKRNWKERSKKLVGKTEENQQKKQYNKMISHWQKVTNSTNQQKYSLKIQNKYYRVNLFELLKLTLLN